MKTFLVYLNYEPAQEGYDDVSRLLGIVNADNYTLAEGKVLNKFGEALEAAQRDNRETTNCYSYVNGAYYGLVDLNSIPVIE